MEFEWDKKKAKSNETKHGISFHEAGTVFGDPLALTFDDPDNSLNEVRLITFGLSRLGGCPRIEVSIFSLLNIVADEHVKHNM